MKTLLVVLLCIVASSSALAAPYSTANLKADCDAYIAFTAGSALKPAEDGFCMGYVLAFTQMEAGYTVQVPDGSFYKYDWTDGVTGDQVIRVFVKYVNDHPEFLNKSAIASLLLATGETGLRTGTPLAKSIVAKEQ
jgi:hypothetical protein